MRGAALWIVAMVAGCAPDYAHSAFRCDAQHGCPDGQRCRDGRCRRGEPTGDGVTCGAKRCGPAEQCCVDAADRPDCAAAGEACPGDAALCDGSEDCQMGDRCCADGDTAFCDATCNHYACADAADCPLTAPICCRDFGEHWGQCRTSGC
jgi:hypothetical protein